jgi:hypothetical protein
MKSPHWLRLFNPKLVIVFFVQVGLISVTYCQLAQKCFWQTTSFVHRSLTIEVEEKSYP